MIFGVHITDRAKKASDVQRIFTEYGCNIKTRIGLHDVTANACSPSGLVVLEMFGDEKTCLEMAGKLGTIDGVEVQKMVFK